MRVVSGTTTAMVRARVQITLRRPDRIGAELVTFTQLSDAGEHVACIIAGRSTEGPPLVRLHSECLTGDVFGSTRCDCGPQLDEALERVSVDGGIILYLRQEGRGIGLYNKLDAYLLQENGLDTFEANRRIGRGADERDYRVAAEMLAALGVKRIRLLTNNPDKVRQLRSHGIQVDEVVHTGVYATAENAGYLRAKVGVTGHSLHLKGE